MIIIFKGTENAFCHLLLQMARIDMDLNNQAKFYKFLCYACKNQHKKLLK